MPQERTYSLKGPFLPHKASLTDLVVDIVVDLFLNEEISFLFSCLTSCSWISGAPKSVWLITKALEGGEFKLCLVSL